MPRRSIIWFGGVVMLLAASRGTAEPHVGFVLKNGWVECTLHQEGKPISDAVIHVIDDGGKNFAEGQTGDDGQGAFPLPRGTWFTVEIKTGERTADPIRLFKLNGNVEPARVLLSYGLRPCCRLKAPRDTPTVDAAVFAPPEPRDTPPLWWLLLTVPVGLCLTAEVALIVQRPLSRSSNALARE